MGYIIRAAYANLNSITVILTDKTGAFTKNVINVTVGTYSTPDFSKVQNITLSSQEQNQVQIKVDIISSYLPSVVNCSSSSLVSFAMLSSDSLYLVINASQASNSDDRCIRLMSMDSCGKQLFSKPIQITFKESEKEIYYAPVITGKFGPLVVGKGENKVFRIPNSLFYDIYLSYLKYSVSGCIDKFGINPKISVSKYQSEDEYYLLIYSNEAFTCTFPLYATNVKIMTTEILVDLHVVNCASKDCQICAGPYESNCTQCIEGYSFILDHKCQKEDVHFDLSNLNYYIKCGMTVSVFIILNLIFSIKFGISRIQLITHGQTIIFLMFSNPNLSKNLKSFTINFQWIKLDFGFVIPSLFKTSEFCSHSTTKMENIQFYCQEMSYNYILILLIFACLICTSTIKILLRSCLKREQSNECLTCVYNYLFCEICLDSNIYNQQNNGNSFAFGFYRNLDFYKFCAIQLMWQFMTISLIYDFITYENHYWMTVVSLFFLVVFIFWLTVVCIPYLLYFRKLV